MGMEKPLTNISRTRRKDIGPTGNGQLNLRQHHKKTLGKHCETLVLYYELTLFYYGILGSKNMSNVMAY